MNTPHTFFQRLASHMPLRNARRLLGVGAAALALCFATPQSHAQMGLGMMGGEMGDLIKPATNARLLKQYAEILGLSADQKRAADELLIAYQTEFRDSVARLEEIFQSMSEEVQESGEYEVYQTVMPNTMLKFMKKAEGLNNTFMSDLKSLLDQGQMDRFPAVERLHRRSASIKMGLDGVQKVDLFDVVRGLRLDPATSSSTAPVLEQYSIELDRELVARDKMMRSFFEEMVKLIDEGKQPEQDPTVFQKWIKDLGDAGKRIETLNLKYIPMVRAAVPETAQAEYDSQIKLAKYPSIYRRSYAARVFDAVDKIPDLDATQKEGFKTLKETYTRDAGAANDKWASVMDELKSGLQGEEAMFGGGMWRIHNDAKYTEARDARKAIDDKAVDAVKALLTEPQRAKLPKKNYRPEWDFDRQPGQ